MAAHFEVGARRFNFGEFYTSVSENCYRDYHSCQCAHFYHLLYGRGLNLERVQGVPDRLFGKCLCYWTRSRIRITGASARCGYWSYSYFSDALNIEDVVELSGQIGRVEHIGLRFTTLVNFYGQRIYVPNRDIAVISRFRRGAMRAYVDIQIPEGVAKGPVVQKAKSLVAGLYDQHRSIILQQPEVFGIREAKGGDWRFLRVKFRIWPGQGSLVENTFKQTIIALMTNLYPDYAEWMVTVTYRVE